MKKLLMVFNPKAGKNSTREKHDDILRVFREYGLEVTEKTTTCVGDATEIVKHNHKGHAAIICCGGDGTFNEVINGVMASGADIPIMYIPMGSTNDLANTVGVTKDLNSQVELFLNGSIKGYDVGSFNDTYFTYVASFGVGTDVSYMTSQKMKNILGHAAYILNGFVFNLPHQIKNLKPHHMVIEYDGGVIDDDFFFGAISNTNEVAGLFKFDNCDVKLNDGLFEVILVRKLKNVPDAFYLLKKIRDQDYDGDRIITFKTSKMKMICDEELAWTLDGEFGGKHSIVNIGIEPSAVKIVAPHSKYFISDKPVKDEEENEDVFYEEEQELAKAGRK